MPGVNGPRLIMVSKTDIIDHVNRKSRKVMAAVFSDPILSNILWTDIETLLRGLGAELTEGRGSRVRISLNGVRSVFHRPHPQKETDRNSIRDLRELIKKAGV